MYKFPYRCWKNSRGCVVAVVSGTAETLKYDAGRPVWMMRPTILRLVRRRNNAEWFQYCERGFYNLIKLSRQHFFSSIVTAAGLTVETRRYGFTNTSALRCRMTFIVAKVEAFFPPCIILCFCRSPLLQHPVRCYCLSQRDLRETVHHHQQLNFVSIFYYLKSHKLC